MILHWAGWETNTFRLQENGWQLSAHQDPINRMLRIAINHPNLSMQGITALEHYDFERAYRENVYSGNPVPAPISLFHMGKDIYIKEYNMGRIDFQAIDATPQFMSSEIRKLSDLAHFQTIQKPQHEIFLKEASIDEILEMALKKQEPGQEQIRKRIMHEQKMKQYGLLHTELKVI